MPFRSAKHYEKGGARSGSLDLPQNSCCPCGTFMVGRENEPWRDVRVHHTDQPTDSDFNKKLSMRILDLSVSTASTARLLTLLGISHPDATVPFQVLVMGIR